MRIAVAVIFPGDRLQHPVTPVQKDAKIDMKAMMNKAITDRPMSVAQHNRNMSDVIAL